MDAEPHANGQSGATWAHCILAPLDVGAGIDISRAHQPKSAAPLAHRSQWEMSAKHHILQNVNLRLVGCAAMHMYITLSQIETLSSYHVCSEQLIESSYNVSKHVRNN